jgi:hypothetical protein
MNAAQTSSAGKGAAWEGRKTTLLATLRLTAAMTSVKAVEALGRHATHTISRAPACAMGYRNSARVTMRAVNGVLAAFATGTFVATTPIASIPVWVA